MCLWNSWTGPARPVVLIQKVINMNSSSVLLALYVWQTKHQYGLFKVGKVCVWGGGIAREKCVKVPVGYDPHNAGVMNVVKRLYCSCLVIYKTACHLKGFSSLVANDRRSAYVTDDFWRVSRAVHSQLRVLICLQWHAASMIGSAQ